VRWPWYRNSLAKYVLPSYNEWYKAAFYNPTNSTWYDYANGSNTAPTPVASGTTADTAVYGQPFAQGPADVDQAGGLSPYGVMGLGGNVIEYDETSYNLANSSGSSFRGRRGGSWVGGSSDLSSSTRNEFGPTNGINEFFGFRVASLSSSAAPVPEPTSTAIFGLAALGMAYRARRNSRNKT
jgi:sulfatase modifying factor 1